jgi:hypothetical protein
LVGVDVTLSVESATATARRSQDAFFPFIECFEKVFPATHDANVTLHACAKCVRRQLGLEPEALGACDGIRLRASANPSAR